MKTLTARQIIRLEYGTSKNFVTPDVIKVGKIDKYTAYEISSGYMPSFIRGGTGRTVYGVSVVFWLPTDENPNATRRAYEPWSQMFNSLNSAEYHIRRLKGEDPIHSWYGDHVGEISLFLSDAEVGSHQGDCSADIEELLREDYIKIQFANLSPDKVKAELRETGAWEDEELQDFGLNCERLLWIVCGNICDEVSSND